MNDQSTTMRQRLGEGHPEMAALRAWCRERGLSV